MTLMQAKLLLESEHREAKRQGSIALMIARGAQADKDGFMSIAKLFQSDD